MIPLFVLPFTLLVVLASSIGGDRHLWNRFAVQTAHIVVQEEGETPPSTRRSRPSQNDDPSLCAALYTFGGVGELYRRRSPF